MEEVLRAQEINSLSALDANPSTTLQAYAPSPNYLAGLARLRNQLTPTSDVSQSVDLGQNNNPNTTPTKDYEIVRVVVYLCGVQRGCAEEGERGSTPTG